MRQKSLKNLSTLDKIQNAIPVQFQSQVPKPSLSAEFCLRGAGEVIKGKISKEEAGLEGNLDPVKPGTEAEIVGENIDYSLFNKLLNRLSGHVKTIFEMQLIWSLRAVEALEIKNKHILQNGLIWIPSRKHSNARYIYCPKIIPLKNHNPVYANGRIFILSYTAYYNALKKAGICFSRSKRYKLAIVTHSARKFNLSALQRETGANIQELMAYSGHKSINGIMYYLGKNSLS